MMKKGIMNNEPIMDKEDYRREDGLLYCGVCHEPKEEYFPDRGKHLDRDRFPRMCACKRKEYALLQKREEEFEHERMLTRLREQCFRDKRMIGWRFENDNGSNSKMYIAKNYVDCWGEEEYGLILWGSVGVGKTYMAACIANALIEKGVSVHMTNFATILNDLNSHYNDRNEYIQKLCVYDLLIIDDLGMERTTGFSLEQICNIIDARCSSKKPLIITTNLTIDDLKSVTDMAFKRIYDRILSVCIPVLIEGKSQREEEAKIMMEKFKEKLFR